MENESVQQRYLVCFLKLQALYQLCRSSYIKKKRKLKEPLASILRLKKWEFYMTYIYMT